MPHVLCHASIGSQPRRWRVRGLVPVPPALGLGHEPDPLDIQMWVDCHYPTSQLASAGHDLLCQLGLWVMPLTLQPLLGHAPNTPIRV